MTDHEIPGEITPQSSSGAETVIEVSNFRRGSLVALTGGLIVVAIESVSRPRTASAQDECPSGSHEIGRTPIGMPICEEDAPPPPPSTTTPPPTTRPPVVTTTPNTVPGTTRPPVVTSPPVETAPKTTTTTLPYGQQDLEQPVADGITNEWDNCDFVFNPIQENMDGDIDGDVCERDGDKDGDGFYDGTTDPSQLDYLDTSFGTDQEGLVAAERMGVVLDPGTEAGVRNIQIARSVNPADWEAVVDNFANYGVTVLETTTTSTTTTEAPTTTTSTVSPTTTTEAPTPTEATTTVSVTTTEDVSTTASSVLETTEASTTTTIIGITVGESGPSQSSAITGKAEVPTSLNDKVEAGIIGTLGLASVTFLALLARRRHKQNQRTAPVYPPARGTGTVKPA